MRCPGVSILLILGLESFQNFAALWAAPQQLDFKGGVLLLVVGALFGVLGEG